MAAVLRKGWSWYRHQLSVKPFRTQMVTSGILWAAGDAVAQSIDSATVASPPSPPSATQESQGKELHGKREEFDWKRLAVCSSFGVTFVGPVGHLWYEALEYVVNHKLHMKPNSLRFLVTKVLADSFIFGPIHLLGFFTYMSLASGRTFKELKEDLKRDFIPAFMMEEAIWPLVQFVNFRHVPVQHQLLLVNGFCILDSAFLSWFKHQEDAMWKKWLLSFIILPTKEE